MSWNIKPLIAEIKYRRRGIIIGAITGLVAAQYAISTGADLNSIVDAGKGLIDNVMTRSAPVEVAKYKLYIAFSTIGAVIGFFADKLMAKR